MGIKIHLHCFYKDRKPQDELKKYCTEVFYYKRKNWPIDFHLSVPYIVRSRRNAVLQKRILENNYPVLMEGTHTTWLLYSGILNHRKTIVRLHNVEHTYYRKLAAYESNIFKKCYFLFESFLLKRYESSIAHKSLFVAVSKEDAEFFSKKFGAETKFLPVFLPWQEVKESSDRGCFCLYHGNLSVNENEKAADWLMNSVFDTIDIPLVVAGKSASLPLQCVAHSRLHTCITCNPSNQEMDDLISKAHIHILPSFNQTGVKLKLLNALFNGRHCIVNKAGTSGSETASLCHIAETADEFKATIKALYEMPFSKRDIEERKLVLENLYDNDKNAKQLIEWLY